MLNQSAYYTKSFRFIAILDDTKSGASLLSPEEYREQLPSQLTQLHAKRERAILSFWTEKGDLKISFRVGIKKKKFEIDVGINKLFYGSTTVQDFLGNSDAIAAVAAICNEKSVDFNYVLSLLTEFATINLP